ncbi:hypothetical protein K8Z61_11005 [Nocardioides sp. TRM66260-LWL]|uniref:hypothetical protein n=1 Tax=Nocardioides sp. TRM66260-LWL TaxID=2874478 RepID=UPI001CC64300|nr:hypothetical protein [Nocardioides sp. TRM66260-LWL]MBZ5735027.1 hypothetical protein [Nocardioides sp. TRM66260-LWL]
MSAPSSYSPALRVVAHLAAGGLLARRASTGVVHVVAPGAPVTSSGRYVAAGARPVCGRPYRRLTVVHAGHAPVARLPRRFCRACLTALPASPAVAAPAGRDAEATAFGHLDLRDFAQAHAWLAACSTATAGQGSTAAQTHHDALTQLRRLLSVTHGPALLHRPPTDRADSTDLLARWRLDQALNASIAAARLVALAPDTRDALEQKAADRAADDRLRAQARARQDRIDRAGGYQTPWERDLTATA